MRAERPGSYSIPLTTAGMPTFSRRKSTSRSMRLCPPPRWRTVMRPYEFRPLPRFLGESRLFSGVFFVISSLVSCVMYRRAGEVGLSVRIPMALGPLDQLDLVTGRQRHDRRLLEEDPLVAEDLIDGGVSRRLHFQPRHVPGRPNEAVRPVRDNEQRRPLGQSQRLEPARQRLRLGLGDLQA